MSAGGDNSGTQWRPLLGRNEKIPLVPFVKQQISSIYVLLNNGDLVKLVFFS